MFRSKHIIVALIIAPILSLVAYFAVDYTVREVPHKLQSGGQYPLLVKPNCRWQSGRCTLVNGDIELHLSPEGSSLLLRSDARITQIKIALIDTPDTDSSEVTTMQQINQNTFTLLLSESSFASYVRLAVWINGNIFYATVPLQFMIKEDRYGIH